MSDPDDRTMLDSPPTADRISQLREQAAAAGESVQVTFSTDTGDTKRFVVSPRGTCVLLNDTREDSFNPSVDAADIADALPD